MIKPFLCSPILFYSLVDLPFSRQLSLIYVAQIFATLFCAWLGGLQIDESPGKQGRFLTIDEVGKVLGVPVNLKDEDSFHVSLEEYLHALINLIDELVSKGPSMCPGLRDVRADDRPDRPDWPSTQ